MTVQPYNNPDRKDGFSAWYRYFFITIIVLILLGLIWFFYDRLQRSEQVANLPEIKKARQSQETPGGTLEAVSPETVLPLKPAPEMLNLDMVPMIEKSNTIGPQLIVDELEESFSTEIGSSTDQERSTELNYGYKGHDEQGVHLELGASEKSMQIKFGVQAGDKKVNVNSIEVEIPLSK
ncbi:MAG: hypothetical protein CO158_06225 [Piscirickettsiaceae bacterium CG_4_9_14_3_um_filter_43_564]|nr:hypothetical protein [Thiomicrospira sp.]OIP93641.1 MAG: hypothetical protein AUK56_11290 [Thiomicrospira sp. CG2_30_44_34]PIQ02853.1 MAG: hypothetical protein COW74_09370 [Piscirickettsiaceae bacterium CG18_big_fil_WC_8_21_14_2_50_44_103]PIU39130.1 MAG: hypothetical protein COT01_03005 [Piscirickettsiaceae bacterium CG07_land_8_20_14_0_80_44_28]PIW58615.1 MAG: hypothetical protein COW14_00405 [Piscirickettsiaceae bacterium CG12_big_fil_rev_8_21_14_0_65_44_934]PIW76861.1 MAG: hypothetical p